MESRKIYSSGKSSYIITLPKKWIIENGLKAGDEVILNVGKEQITILPKQVSRGKKSAEINAEDMNSNFLVRTIIAYYLAGYDSIRIKNCNGECRRAVALASEILIGAEIIEDLGKEILMEVFLDYSRLKPKNVMERMSNMCLTMISDFNQTLREFNRLVCSSIIAREDEIDRLHFVLLRQLREASKYDDIAVLLEINNYQEYRTIVRAVERIADHISKMAESLINLGKAKPELCEIVEECKELLKTSLVSLFKGDAELAEIVIEESDKVFGQEAKLYQWIVSHNLEEALILQKIVDSLMRIASYSTDIAEVVINMSVE